MRPAARGRTRAGEPATTGSPLRTCLGCRRARPRGELLRLVRDPEGFVEADPRRRRGGRGAYLCRDGNCLDQAVRRSRWGHAFRGPTALRPETVTRLRALIEPQREPTLSSQSRDAGTRPAGRASGRPVAPVEGRR